MRLFAAIIECMDNNSIIRAAVTPFAAVALAFLCGCASTVPRDQLSVFGGDPRAKGSVPAYRLRSYGTWGAGTLASGKADMVFDGLYFHRLAGAKATPLAAAETISEGWASRFRPDLVVALPANFDRAALVARVDRAVPDRTMPCVFRIVGQFSELAVTSPSGNATIRRAPGALYGFRTPGRDGGTRVETWFLSSDYSAGGRVTGFTMAEGSLAIDLCPQFLFINTALSQSEKLLR